jgi:hypothetical protein
MPLELKDLKSVVLGSIRQLANVKSELLTQDSFTVDIDQIDFQVNLIAPNGVGALELTNITATPRRISTTETPETVEVSTQDVGAQTNRVTDTSNKESIADQAGNNETTQFYGRETISTTTHKD